MANKTTLRSLLDSGRTLVAPGVFDGLSAKLVEQAKFELVYASGGAIARSAGYPDLGLLSMSEVCQRLADICDAVSVPVIADADTGYGNELNVKRCIKEFVRLGVSGLHLEDQQFPKRCGHLDDKNLISTDEMVIKLKAARASAPDDFVIIARTDAIAVEGFDAAIERAQAYANAGADMLFVEAPESEEQIEAIADKIPQPKLINMFYGGKTPLIPMSRLESLGYRVVIIPSDLQRASIHAMQQALEAIKRDGDSKVIADQLVSFADREKIIGTTNYLKN